MTITETPACWLSPQNLAYAFWGSFTDEENFVGSDDTEMYAREIVSRGDDMWNWPSAVTDAEAYLAGL